MSAVIVLILRILLSLLLLGFVGFTLYVIWRDVRSALSAQSAQIVKPIYLQLDPETSKSARKFTDAEILIGRDPACQFTISDTAISAKHARLYYRQNQWWIEDLGSTNGTLLNLELLEAPAILVDGDLIRIGNHDILLTIVQLTD